MSGAAAPSYLRAFSRPWRCDLAPARPSLCPAVSGSEMSETPHARVTESATRA